MLLHIAFPYLQWHVAWHDLINYIEACKHEIKIIQVNWKTPPTDNFKLNMDGSAMNNPGKIGGGGILRDHQGNMIYAFSIPLGIGSNNLAETLAAQQGIYWCVQHSFKKIILEVDLKLLANWISYKSKPLWQIQQHIRELMRLVRQLEFFECKHIFREANNTTDFLAKGSHNSDNITLIISFLQLLKVATC
ncbi:hypothetical protein MTR67_026211 [Solanum verrucosum]|uniref:RNase H type-1 domain-containing protein n=1 Tax=Solanum verrucosum TaxID=315347 RepID=A0AAF0TU89_SOLVR|nr:hypothetical protein MTR67_026211 [Solanum verrucosum]